MDVTTGTRTELAGAGSAATTALLLAAGADGIRTQTEVLSAEAAGAPALADGRAYWLDAAGQPQTKALTPATDGEL